MKTTLQLFQEISEKVSFNNTESGSVSLLRNGRPVIFKKLFEEAAEVWMACNYESNDQKSLEISQYLYYVMIFCIHSNLDDAEIHTLFSNFENDKSAESFKEPNKLLIHLTTGLAVEAFTKSETADKVKSILNVISYLIESNNLTKMEIYNKL